MLIGEFGIRRLGWVNSLCWCHSRLDADLGGWPLLLVPLAFGATSCAGGLFADAHDLPVQRLPLALVRAVVVIVR
jgi:hypothetical protein